MTRDEIIDLIKLEPFSVRYAFFKRLDDACWVTTVGSHERVKIAWPDALTVIPLDKWEEAFIDTMRERDKRRREHRATVSETNG